MQATQRIILKVLGKNVQPLQTEDRKMELLEELRLISWDVDGIPHNDYLGLDVRKGGGGTAELERAVSPPADAEEGPVQPPTDANEGPRLKDCADIKVIMYNVCSLQTEESMKLRIGRYSLGRYCHK